jgi:hypothetical protein
MTTFADWKRRSRVYQSIELRLRHLGFSQDLSQATKLAFAAGVEEGRRQAEDIALRAMELRERMRNAKLDR